MGLRVVVTGAAGFVGGALIRRLLQQSDVEVVAVSRQPLEAATQVTPVLADLGKDGWCDALPSQADVVVHLAQSQLYGSFPDGAPDMVRINVDATAALLDWSRRSGVRRFVLASTANVYRPSLQPLSEDMPCEPEGFYASSKLSAELLARAYRNLFQVVVARIFTVYGPRQRRGLFRTLMNSVEADAPVTFTGAGGLRLSPLYIDDCAEALARLILAPQTANETLVNVAGAATTDIRSIAEAIGRLSGKQPRLQQKDGPEAAFIADNRRLQALLNWLPQMPVETGIARMLAGGVA